MAKEWVLGQQLGHYVGREVLVLGSVEQVESSGRTLRVRSTDDLLIVAQLGDTLKEDIAPGTYVEVCGLVRSRNEIANASVSDFPDTTQLEARVVNEAIQLFQENANEVEREAAAGEGGAF